MTRAADSFDATMLLNVKPRRGDITNTRYSITQARNDLSRLLREAESGTTVELTRRGRRVAVIVGRRQYERFIARKCSFSEAWRKFASDGSLAELQIDSDDVFGHVRDSEPGRNVSFHESGGEAGARS